MKILSNEKYEELLDEIRDLEFKNKQLTSKNELLDGLLCCDIARINKFAIFVPKDNPLDIKVYDGKNLLDMSQCKYIQFEAYPNELPTLTIEK